MALSPRRAPSLQKSWPRLSRTRRSMRSSGSRLLSNANFSIVGVQYFCPACARGMRFTHGADRRCRCCGASRGRTHDDEIAIRLALGATSRNIALMVVREFSPILVAGIVSGVVGAEVLLGVLGSLIRSVGRTGAPLEISVATLFATLVAATIAFAMRPAFLVPPAEAIRLSD